MLIPIILKIITIPATEKIIFFRFIESDPRKEVRLESCSFLSEIFSEGAKFKKVGSKVKVITNEVIRPKVIIHPKSIIGLISLKIKDKKAKIVVNAGIGTIKEDNKAIEKMKKELSLITGQAPVVRLSKMAIASFKIRKGMPVGLSVTLRKTIMKEFYDRLVNIAMPRIKDFRGFSKKSFDGQGNITIGIRDHIIFPEISVENVENVFGFDITIVTSANNNKEGYELLKLMNFPFLN